MTKKQNVTWWAARRAVIDARGGPVRKPRVNVEAQFEKFKWRGGDVKECKQ
jgi:hypothetical protein